MAVPGAMRIGPRLAKSDHALFTIEPGREPLAAAIAGLRTVIPEGATPLPEVTLTCDVECDASVFLHPQTLDAIALVRQTITQQAADLVSNWSAAQRRKTAVRLLSRA